MRLAEQRTHLIGVHPQVRRIPGRRCESFFLHVGLIYATTERHRCEKPAPFAQLNSEQLISDRTRLMTNGTNCWVLSNNRWWLIRNKRRRSFAFTWKILPPQRVVADKTYINFPFPRLQALFDKEMELLTCLALLACVSFIESTNASTLGIYSR